jgi:hypothetical protein
MPLCPKCNSQVDIGPAYRAYNWRGVFVRGQGVRCRGCETVLEFSQWRALVVKFAPVLLLVPFVWYRDTSVPMRLVVAALVVGPFLITTIRLFPSLFELKIPSRDRNVLSDDELY